MSVQAVKHGPGEWANWSENLCGWAAEQVTFAGRAAPNGALAWCRAAGDEWRKLLGAAAAQDRDLRPFGGGWSFTGILATNGVLAQTSGLGRMFRACPTWFRPGVGSLADALVLVGGGVSVRKLNRWLRAQKLSLVNSGASDGQSIAGAIATGTHGSRPALGGMQAQVMAVHLIGGPDRAWWLERPSAVPGGPLLTDEAVRALGVDLSQPAPAGAFEAAQVHLGGLGVVNAVLLRVRPRRRFRVIKAKAKLDRAALTLLQAGKFLEFAARAAPQAPDLTDPDFVQVILNPFDPYGEIALVDLLFEDFSLVPPPLWKAPISLEPLELVGQFTRANPHLRRWAVTTMMKTIYREVPDRPDQRAYKHWDELMGRPVHDRMGQLFTAAVAVERSNLMRTVDVMHEAFVRHGGGDLVFTLRFVRGGEGTLAFTRFDHNVVIDMDGIRTEASKIAAARVFDELEASGIPFSYHWGKVGRIDADKIGRDYGRGAGGVSPLSSWKAARAMLLDPRLHRVFGGDALKSWGLTCPPAPTPAAATAAARPTGQARSRPASAGEAADRA
ncbi:FAD-binding protein [Sphingomonas lenta]|uniref:FAD-binding PCMH-type domain-containing protein n=1 Tax=Sphingomonas lenta TaxID=1141887 RepID=A0A2A2SB56_9SPHN|nr:FAD-binding protein [Sphingomonas lenta]PAX06534.1 hypothetical protein CKY28_15375 [Sphingomonas lenta]